MKLFHVLLQIDKTIQDEISIQKVMPERRKKFILDINCFPARLFPDYKAHLRPIFQ